METNTLKLVEDDKVMIAILNALSDTDINIVSADDNKVVVKAGCLPVTISWEMCSCHGGRMWFNQDKTNIHIELSSGEYDYDHGIDTPEKELAHYIDKMMVDTIKSFEKYVYVVDTTGKYGNKDRFDRAYFNNIDSASRYVFDEDGHDLNNQFDTVIHQYPNPDMQLKVEYMGENNGALLYRGTNFKRDKDSDTFLEDYSYDIKFWMYRKNVKRQHD